MSAIPNSVNPSVRPPIMADGVSAKHIVCQASSLTYTAGQTARIVIPTSAGWLHGSESFIRYKVTYSGWAAGTAGSITLDGSAYSHINALTLTHGVSQLVQQQECGRVWNMMRDHQSYGYDSVGLGSDETGPTQGHAITNNSTYEYSYCLPVSLLGSLSSGIGLPLGWMASAGELVLELTFEQAARVAQLSGASDAPTVGTYTVTDLAYFAKITQVDSTVDAFLRQPFQQGSPVTIPAIELSCQTAAIATGSGLVSQRLSAQYSSLKGLIYWMCPTASASGTIATNQSARAICARTLGPLAETWVSIDGSDVPSVHMRSEKGALTSALGLFPGVIWGNVRRFFNTLGAADAPNLIRLSDFASSAHTNATVAGDTSPPRGIVALDLDRGSQDEGSTVYQGTRTSDSTVMVHMRFASNLSEAQNLYVVAMHDVSYVLENGLLRRLY